jgi:hypothetical protein
MNNIEKAIVERIIYHSDEKKYRYELGKGVIEYCAKDILNDVLKLQNQEQGKRKCENCEHLRHSDKTNRLYCNYHSEGDYWHETYKDDYCSYYELIKAKEVCKQ